MSTKGALARPLRGSSRPPEAVIRRVQPFTNETPSLGCLGWTKTILVICTGLPLLRMVLFLFHAASLVVYLALVRLICGRCLREPYIDYLFAPVRWSARMGLLYFGYWWIEEVYPPGTPWCDRWAFLCCSPRFLRRRSAIPSVLVANHTTFMDALIIGSRVLPIAVGKAGIVRIPLIGPVLASLNPILVPRTPEEKAALPPVMEQLVAKARSGVEGHPGPRLPPVMVFPEGTTVNQRHVIAFQRGAFVPAVPVMPIAMEYPFCALDVAQPPHVPNYVVFLRQLCTLWNRVRVTYLPVYTPSAAERADPKLFAEGVRGTLALRLGRSLAPHTDRDALLVDAARARYAALGSYTINRVLPSLLTRDIEAALRLPLRLTVLSTFIDIFFNCDSAGDGYMRRENVSAAVLQCRGAAGTGQRGGGWLGGEAK